MSLNKIRDTADELKMLLKQRLQMDRRRLEEGFLLLASLEVIRKYEIAVSAMPCDRNWMVEMIVKPFCEVFVNKWGSKLIKLR